MESPFFGSRRMAVTLNVNRKRMQRLMRLACIEALYPKPRLSAPAPGHRVYPYLLRDLRVERPKQVWRRILRIFRCVAAFGIWSP